MREGKEGRCEECCLRGDKEDDERVEEGWTEKDQMDLQRTVHLMCSWYWAPFRGPPPCYASLFGVL